MTSAELENRHLHTEALRGACNGLYEKYPDAIYNSHWELAEETDLELPYQSLSVRLGDGRHAQIERVEPGKSVPDFMSPQDLAVYVKDAPDAKLTESFYFQDYGDYGSEVLTSIHGPAPTEEEGIIWMGPEEVGQAVELGLMDRSLDPGEVSELRKAIEAAHPVWPPA